MSARLVVETPGMLTTLQDRGRIGWQRFGVPVSGAMDPVALAIANALVGNPPWTAALEMTLAGASLRIEGEAVRVALAGGDFPLDIDGVQAEAYRSHRLEPGQRLRVGAARAGARVYLAVAGGFDLLPVLGSLSVHTRSGLGPLGGRALAAGDVLPVAGPAGSGGDLALAPGFAPPAHPCIRVVPGPQDDWFTAAALETLRSSEYTVSAQADRMGYRLAGPALEHARGFNIVSDAIAPGSIQVPGTGEPIILMADRQTTGGYPKIATVIGADLPSLGQKRPGDRLRFEVVSLDQAQAVGKALARWLADLPSSLVPTGRVLDSERLLSLNLIDGVVKG